jgi:uncharacterized protein with HEPN domain
MRSEQQYLLDIVEAADAVARFLVGVDREAFLKDELRQSAVIQKIGVIGEAAGKVEPPLRSKYPEVDWPKVVGMRNILVHAYFSVKLEIVWQTAVQSVPDIREKVARILANEFPSN